MTVRSVLLRLAIVTVAVGCDGREDAHEVAGFGDDNHAIDALFASWDKPGSPGCALAVTRHGEPVYSRGYGYANLDHDTPVTPRTVFDVGSVTKQFVAASISMLELAGKLSLDDSIRTWLPELPDSSGPITLRHMIYHTSGLRDYLTLFPLAGRDHYHPISHAHILDMMSRQRALVFPPGERYLYSNTAYMLLAQVIERASGKKLGAFAEDGIFEPLGMEGSLMYDNYEEVIPRRATGYDRHDDGNVRMVHNFNFDVPGDGQLYTTVEDLLRWDNYLHGAEKPAIHAAMLTEGTLNSGEATGLARGLFLGEYRSLRTIQHTGSSWGSRSVLIRFVDPGLAIAIACNDGFSSPLRLAHRVADHYLENELAGEAGVEESGGEPPGAGETYPKPTLSPQQLADYAGSFFSPELDAIYRFTVVDDGLVVRIEQQPPLAVLPMAEDRFEISFDEQAYSGVLTASVTFARDATGAVTGFDLSSGTESGIVFVKHQFSAVGTRE